MLEDLLQEAREQDNGSLLCPCSVVTIHISANGVGRVVLPLEFVNGEGA
jgi:hypothetical protein